MLEGVLKVGTPVVLGCVFGGFNPWYVGGGVKSVLRSGYCLESNPVSILGMLEGVLKDRVC